MDASSVHPEAYSVARKILVAAGGGPATQLDPQAFVDGTFGLPTVKDIMSELEKPGRDPRPAFKAASFSEGIEKISDLKPGMILEGTVTNVAAFGAFVDVGVHQDGLVHVSALSNKFVSDPREIVKSGQVVRVKVLEADSERKRISLTLRLDDEPGTGAAAPQVGVLQVMASVLEDRGSAAANPVNELEVRAIAAVTRAARSRVGSVRASPSRHRPRPPIRQWPKRCAGQGWGSNWKPPPTRILASRQTMALQ